MPPSLPAWFHQHGYVTVSVGKVSHHPGGRGGPDWNDSSQPEMPNSWDRHLMPTGPWQHPRGAMHGLARGEIRRDAKEMDLFQAVEGPDDMPAHVRSVLTQGTLSIPVNEGRDTLGTWQGIYLWEHRRRGSVRRCVVHVST